MNFDVLKYKINKRLIWLFGDKKYKNYKDALNDCVSNGYENDLIINLAKEKAKVTRQTILNGVKPQISNLNIFPLLSLINDLSFKQKNINVIDFGGGDGGYYLYIRELIRPEIGLNWQVVETSEMVKAMKGFTTDELSFCNNLDESVQKMGKIDVVHTSGTIQYTPNPYDFLEKMLNSHANYIIFNRNTFNSANTDLITIQRSLLSWHGSSDITGVSFTDCEIKYPLTNISIQKFETAIQKKYSIIYTFDDLSGVRKVRYERIVGKSYVLKRLENL